MIERVDGRAIVFDSLVEIAADHVVGLKAIKKLGGFPKATHLLENRVPTTKIGRSGMLGEILATEYVAQETEFSVPVRRLRHRDTRELAMRGDDVLGFRLAKTRVKVMKVEAKSRVSLATAHLAEARTGLANHRGRPNPETLAFLECILRLDDRDTEADPITFLLKNPIYVKDVCHLLFTLSGSAPRNLLEANSQAVHKGIELRLCGCRVKKHADFVKAVFDECVASGK
ncbi:DUF1837 domain-containing protein [Novipirellula aureliae]|nr:DUF1837 domain-containing protein [Novipirellula aureliae]